MICNTYPNIRMIITETGGNLQIRNWLKKLILKNFINFNGKNKYKKENTNPLKTCISQKDIKESLGPIHEKL